MSRLFILFAIIPIRLAALWIELRLSRGGVTISYPRQ